MLDIFERAIPSVLTRRPNPQQWDAISAPADATLFLVAGPGSGKTTVLALRALKLVIVDGLDPGSVVATTFTRKAAKELRSRVLGWGDRIRETLLAGTLPAVHQTRVESLDFNAILTGTLDSLCETILGQYRQPGTQPAPVVEEFVSDALLLRKGLFPGGRFRQPDLEQYLLALRGYAGFMSTAEKINATQTLYQRTVHDAVDMGAYATSTSTCVICGNHPHAGVSAVCDAITDYENALSAQGVVDYPNLERQFLDALHHDRISAFTDTVTYVLVDEYQDTNYLQERIYFALARAAYGAGGAFSVVGDDDQSLYRFRGATVDLFQAFPARVRAELGVTPRTVFLTENYRSTSAIVDFSNSFIELDPAYSAARVTGKPRIRFERDVEHNPAVLGLFRDTVDELAQDLALLVSAIFQGGGYALPNGDVIMRDPATGSLSDVALLAHSPRERASGGRIRLPELIRDELRSLTPAIEVFNPRGQPLNSVPAVQQLCGLMLECIDPGATMQAALTRFPRNTSQELLRWRAVAQRIHGAAGASPQLRRYVSDWARRNPRSVTAWPREVSLADLAYKLVTWIPPMQQDIEGLVHLEVVLRTITQAGRFSAFGGSIVFRGTLEQPSFHEALWSVFAPIADGAVDVDEDLLETLPRDRFNILSIHQSKGLEFPLAIVDVGSDFRMNHAAQAAFRFPRAGGISHNLENELGQFTPNGAPIRSGRERAFDDLTRSSFVAFSRAQDVLLLVGLRSSVTNAGIPNVAMGWRRDGTWEWGPPRLPLQLI